MWVIITNCWILKQCLFIIFHDSNFCLSYNIFLLFFFRWVLKRGSTDGEKICFYANSHVDRLSLNNFIFQRYQRISIHSAQIIFRLICRHSCKLMTSVFISISFMWLFEIIYLRLSKSHFIIILDKWIKILLSQISSWVFFSLQEKYSYTYILLD